MSSTKPNEFFEIPLHSTKITVWCGLSGNKIYWPFFYEDPDAEQPQTINSNKTYPNEWLQQDGSTALTARVTMDLLRARFPQRLISQRSDFPYQQGHLFCPL